MSVIRRPSVLGRRAQRRIDGLTAAFSTATVEAIAVGTWFALVAVETRTSYSAIAGLTVLIFGAFLRTGFYGSAVGTLNSLTLTRRVIAAALFAGSWLCWLLLAETIGGVVGMMVAAFLLASLLAIQFSLERRAVTLRPTPQPTTLFVVPRTTTALLPAIVLAIGATALLGITWFVDVPSVAVMVPVGSRTIFVELGAFVLGILTFAGCSLLAQERRIQRVLAD